MPVAIGEDVGIEDDVLGRKAGLLGQQLVGARADRDLALERVGLALLVERHDDHRRAIGAHQPRLAQEGLFAFLHRDRVDDGLPWTHFSPASITENFDESIITGTRAMSGSAATRLRNSTIAASESMQALVHVDVDDLRAVGDLVARHVERAGVVAGGDQLAELGRAGDVGALADIDERDVGGQRERLEAGEPHQRRDRLRTARGGTPGDGLGDGVDVVRRRAAAAADDVDQAVGGEAADLRRHRLRASRRTGRMRWAGRRWDRRRRTCRRRSAISARCSRIAAAPSAQLRPMEKGRAWRTECQKAVGVWPDSVRPERSVMVPEIISGSRSAALGEDARHGEDRRLGVQRVEDGLDQDDVGAAVDQPVDLLGVGVAQLVEGDGAEAGIVDVRRERGGAVGRPERAGDEAAPAVRLLGLDRRAARQAGRRRGSAHRRAPGCRSRPGRSRSRRRCWSRGCRRRPAHRRNGCPRSPAAGSASAGRCCLEGAVAGRNRSPRNCVSSKPRPWIWVPIAPSRIRMRSAAARVSAVSTSSRDARSVSPAGFWCQFIPRTAQPFASILI